MNNTNLTLGNIPSLHVADEDEKVSAGREAKEEVAMSSADNTSTIDLPIDDHKDEILRSVKSQKVTIIHGETGKIFLGNASFLHR